jgi:hypothetical protein
LFEAASVLEALAQERDQFPGNVEAAAAAALGAREDPGRMFVPAGAGGAVLADAGFVDEGQGAFERGPEDGELGQKVLLELRNSGGFDFHVVCILYHIHTMQEKNGRRAFFFYL